jgi:2-oxoglutarate ferredoxin oxidoreductase subunit gamma
VKSGIRFAGAGGQGVVLASVLLAKAYGLGRGYNISQTQSYGPEARGGACKAELVVSDRDIEYMKVGKADIFAAFNQAGYDKYINETKEGAILLINSTLIETDRQNVCRVPATEIAETLGAPMAVNLVMLGAMTGLLGNLGYDVMKREVLRNFDEKYRDVNLAAFEKGYSHTKLFLDTSYPSPCNRVMVFVTTQKNCDRLIHCGKQWIKENGQLSIIHIASSQFKEFDNERDGEALDYLYESALTHEANLMVIRARDIVDTMENLVTRNNIERVILGESRETDNEANLIPQIRERLGKKTELTVVPIV